MTVDKLNAFESLVGRLDTLNVEFYIMGDINCNLGAPELDHNSRLLNDIANHFSLPQLIEEPTRVSLTSSTLIDLIFTNCPDRVSCSGVYPTNSSGHSLVYAYRKLSTGVQSGNHSTARFPHRSLNHYAIAITIDVLWECSALFGLLRGFFSKAIWTLKK